MSEFQSLEIFLLKNMLLIGLKVKNTVPWTYVISDLNDKNNIRTFYEKEFQIKNQKEFRIKKVVERKGDKLYVKWKGYDDLFNS